MSIKGIQQLCLEHQVLPLHDRDVLQDGDIFVQESRRSIFTRGARYISETVGRIRR